MKYLFYTHSKSAWKGFLSAIESAHSSIYIEMYIFVDDAEEGKELISLLEEKARSGLSVKMVLDAFGSKELSARSADSLRESGVELLFFNRLFRRLHRKIVIVDEKVGFVGGVNIHKSARLWADLLVRVEGPIVYSLVRTFSKVYRACGGTDAHLVHYHKKAILGRTRIWFLEHLPSVHLSRLKNSYKEAILQARKEILISTPYFLPHRWLRKLLMETKERGIKIRIFVPQKTDIGFITRANYTYMRLFGRRGIDFYMMPEMNHSKLLLVDDTLALVGSQNIDALSFDYNVEAGLFFDDPSMIGDVKKIAADWQSKATLFDPRQSVTVFDRLYSYCVKLLVAFL
ncbi:MAG: phosphatidylserine/phosphatidylglycerophosphate/cardiolipin synthase family protein [Bacteroidota bacterium]